MLKKSFVLCALLLAAASSLPLFAGEYAFHFMPPGYSTPWDTIIDCDLTLGTCSHTPFDWVAGSHEEFQFELNPATPSPAPACYAGSNQVAEVFNCLTSTVATAPSISFAWSVTPGTGFSSSNQVADLLGTVTDNSGQLLIDSGPTLGSGCGPGYSSGCGYGGASFSGTFTTTVVPEPGSVGLTLIVLGLLGLMRKRIVPASR